MANLDTNLATLRSFIKNMGLFHNADNPLETFAEVKIKQDDDNSKHMILPVEGPQFFSYLKAKGISKHGDVRSYYSDSNIRKVVAEAVAKARFKSPGIAVRTRIAEHEGVVYIDLANKEGQIIKVCDGDWAFVDNAEIPVKFIRTPGMLPLATPSKGGDLGKLWDFLNVSPEDRVLVASWLLMCFHPSGPYPLLAVIGEQGCGKSSLMWTLLQLVDPNLAAIRSTPTNEQELVAMAAETRLLAFDNIRKISSKLSDALCRMSTGLGFSGITIRNGSSLLKRPVMINSIEDIGLHSDLLDRTVWVNLPSMSGKQVREDDELKREFAALAPDIFGGLLDAFAKTLQEVKTASVDNLPRMADFAKFAIVAEKHLGFDEGAFREAYDENRKLSDILVIESSVVGSAVRRLLLIEDEWSGTAQSLGEDLEDWFPEIMGRLGRNDLSPRKLSGLLRRDAPHLRRIGIDVNFRKTAEQRMIDITRTRSRTEQDLAILQDVKRCWENIDGKGKGDSERVRAVDEVIAEAKQELADGVDGTDDSNEELNI